MSNQEYNNIPKEKFVLVNENKKLHDKELVTKPIGFFKDAMYRFAKNKGSIVGAIVIGILVLYSIIAPIFSRYTVSYNDIYYAHVLPKVFNSEKFDFLDGAKKQTANLTTFINHYAKGLETGHNAIKRQEYTYNENTRLYTYRLDTYQQVGNVFMSSINRADYYALQEYQDATGIQIIYPITDPELRPKAQKNLKDANVWYKTVPDGTSNDLPADYVINADGSITLPNIYQKFSIPVMSSSSSIDEAAYIVPETKDSGFALKMIVRNAVRDKFGNIESFEETEAGYINALYDRDLNSTETVATFEEASVYTFNSTYNTFTINISGHDDVSEDGVYFFGLPAKQGSATALVKESELGGDQYIPFSLYENNELVTSPLSGNKYFYGVRRTSYSNQDYFCGNYLNGSFKSASSFGNAFKFNLVNTAGGYKMAFLSNKTTQYFVINVNGNNNTFATSLDINEGSIWTFDSNSRLSIDLAGHTDASLDGKYYLSYFNGSNASIGLAKEEQFNDNIFPLYIALTNDMLPATSITDLDDCRLVYRRVVESHNPYYLDGQFKGDNYFSKMRIEGEDNYLYDYAIQKNGGKQYEIRVNYYEYYKYFHKMIAKDRITEPYFLFGTTATGQDIFTCLASGARFSFILAIVVASVNLIVGAIYGAIEGYYGGKVDMIMERIVEILSAVPFMIVITLMKYHMKGSSQVLILFISFFLTGWIGMSGLVRMQFYRFKNQEYVLASRTLGASDPRIMFKHIFPNALGTIVTSCVLVIPGMIFSETSLSYLGIINLNSGNMTSVGTLLANAQPYLVSYPHMILFPAIFISLLMLCFNLFGNGLRDAFNPSLRGTED